MAGCCHPPTQPDNIMPAAGGTAKLADLGLAERTAV
jgi:hypothetical protein